MPNYQFVQHLTNADLLRIWQALWASRAMWQATDPGVHGFDTMANWALALYSELSERGLTGACGGPVLLASWVD